MDLYEMRKKFREKRSQEQQKEESLSNELNLPNESVNTDTLDNKNAKSGDSSVVNIGEVSHEYNYGSNIVTFNCASIKNVGKETTGLLSLVCWISEKTFEGDGWQNDNHADVGQIFLNVLSGGECFYDINRSFEISENLMEIINGLNENGNEWHFIFTINELHEDGEHYIIGCVNGQNENEEVDNDDVEEYDDYEEDISTPYDKMESHIAIRVKGIIEDKFGVDINEITEDSSFKEDLAADSLDLVELVMELEDEFGISIPEGVAESIHTVGDAISYIETEICNS